VKIRPVVVEKVLHSTSFVKADSLELILDVDAHARQAAREFIKEILCKQ